jgi:methylated-DNA-protein-cysteine methyltransferase related protein
VKRGKSRTSRSPRPGGSKSPPKPRMRSTPVLDSNSERILAAVRRIPRGRVSTYGDVADVAGLPRRARLVGTVLRQSPPSRNLPWFRVINASGRISFPVGSDAYKTQRSKLEAEGVVFISGRIDLKKYGWPQREAQLDELLWRMG